MASIKVTLTLREDLLAAIDQYLRDHPGGSRSAVCAAALTEWLREKQEAEIARYYSEMSDAEKAEDRAWGEIAAASAEGLWP